MYKSHVVTYQSSRMPWEVYRSLYGRSEVSFFLDSTEYRPPDQSYSYLGCDPFLEVIHENGQVVLRGEREETYPETDFFNVMRELMKIYRVEEKAHPFFSGGAVGFLSYEFVKQLEKIQFRHKDKTKAPLFYFGFYRDMIAYDHKEGVYQLISHTQDDEKRSLQIIDQFKAAIDAALPAQENDFLLKEFRPEIKKQDFIQMVEKAQEFIRAGDIYQANLSQKFRFQYEGSPLKLYEDLRKINPSPFSSFLKIRDHEVVSNSPERLVSKKGRHCETRPIAGTHPKRSQSLIQRVDKEEFLKNEKERAEHIMLLDLERNDLGRVCDYKSVSVDEMMVLEEYSHVMHIVSKVSGNLEEDKDAFDLIKAMFPGGTITGCPKIRCMQIIDELEPSERGLYTGSIGYLDYHGDMDLNIVIRTIHLVRNEGELQVGAGIVYDSNPIKEYEETLHKGEALTAALVQAEI